MRRHGDQPLDDVADFFELAHQMCLSMEPPGGVDDHDIDMPGQCR